MVKSFLVKVTVLEDKPRVSRNREWRDGVRTLGLRIRNAAESHR